MERNKLLNGIIKKKNDNIDSLKKMMLKRFHRQAKKLKADESIRKIQKFMKKKLKELLDKKNMIKEGFEKFSLFIKRRGFDKIKNKSNNKLNQHLLTGIVEKKDETHKKIFKNNNMSSAF